jgi:hypothetical protein
MSDVVTKDKIDALLSENPALNRFPFRIDKSTQKASVIDIIRMITGKDSRHAGETFKRLGRSLVDRCVQLRINGKGRETSVATAPVLIEIIWELPGKAAKAFRRQSAHMICRILGGDMTLAAEIEKKYNNTPVEIKEFMTTHASPGNTRMYELKLEREELSVMEKRIDITEKNMVVMEKNINLFKMLGPLDDRDTIFLKDLIRTQSKRKMITSDEPEKKSRREISIPLVCSEHGLNPKGKESLIGKKIVALWREKYGRPSHDSPPKRDTYFRGKPYKENCYFSEDYDIVLKAIQTVVTSLI